MNRELMLKIADAIEFENSLTAARPFIDFNMDHWFQVSWKKDPEGFDTSEVCGTSACIAGHACLLAMFNKPIHELTSHELKLAYNRLVSCREEGERILDINAEESGELFLADGEVNMGVIQNLRHHVPAALRWMVLHDHIDWHDAFSAVCPNELAMQLDVFGEELDDGEDFL